MEILVVDDHKIIVEEMIADIEDLNDNYICHGYHSAKEALESAKESHYDVAILDIEMPEMSGIELAGKLREIRSDIMIVFITAYDEYIHDANEINGDHYIVKPYTKETLNNVMAKLIDI